MERAIAAGDFPRRTRAGAVRQVLGRPSGLAGLCIVGAIALVVLAGPALAPTDPAAQDIPARLQGPSLVHPLGTDQLGRDLLSRLIAGARIAMVVALPAVALALLVGVTFGALAGYLGGWLDSLVVVIVDTFQAFPAVILALTLLALLGPSLTNTIVVIAIAFTPSYARVTRAQVLTIRRELYIEAERALGASDRRIVWHHVLPNLLAPLLVLVAMDIPTAVVAEAGLSFLGVGVQPPTPSWGVILADGFARVRDVPWPVLFAGLAIMVTTLGFTMLGETLRDVTDPREVT
jgi:peptide/nickel transport system permease protein